jgi:putative inorganic carbon (HCO3(-)) transporter
MLRKCLLALVTALLVARPLVLGGGEDPGLLADQSDPSGLALLLLWIGGLAAWCGWRLWSGQADFRGGLVELSLLGVVICMFIGAEAAATYKHPARLIAWEWLGFLTAFVLVRQLTLTPEERHGLYTAMLASAVMLSAYAVYQYVDELPMLRARIGNDPNLSPTLRQRIFENNVYSTFAHPNSYAGVMVLFLPGLVGAAWASRRAPRWRLILVAGCALLGFVALWLTHSRGALLGLAIAGGLTGVILGRHWLWRNKPLTIAGLVILVGTAVVVWRGGLLTTGLGKGTGTMAVRLTYWRTTWKMIEDRPALGFGPGNFGRAYPRYMDETAVEKVKDPHNFALEMLVTAGPAALILLLVALGVALLIGSRAWSIPSKEEETTERTGPEPVRWEFYVGGFIGLVLGFLLGMTGRNLGPNDILGMGYMAGLRSVIWFLAFALLERARWTERSRAIVLTTGAVALLLNLCVSGGIEFPSVALPLWACLALLVNTASTRPVGWLSRPGLAVVMPAVLSLVLVLVYFGGVFYPVANAFSTSRSALRIGYAILEDSRKPPKERVLKSAEERKARMRSEVIDPWLAAKAMDPENSSLLLQWGQFTRQMLLEIDIPAQFLPKSDDIVEEVPKLDPENTEGYEIRADLYRIRAERLEAAAAKMKDKEKVQQLLSRAQKEYEDALTSLRPVLRYDPTTPRWHAYLAELEYKAHGKNDPAKWQEEAREALRLDQIQRAQPIQSARVLDDAQRDRLVGWLRKAEAATP